MTIIRAQELPIVRSHKGWDVLELPADKGYLIRKKSTGEICTLAKSSIIDAINSIDLEEDASGSERHSQIMVRMAIDGIRGR